MKFKLIIIIITLSLFNSNSVYAQSEPSYKGTSFQDRLSESYITIKHRDRDLFLAAHDICKYLDLDVRVIIHQISDSYPYDAFVVKEGNVYKIFIKRMAFYSKVLYHEFIHVQQYEAGDLKIKGMKYYWKGKWYDSGRYYSRHHEKDAYKRGRKHWKATRL